MAYQKAAGRNHSSLRTTGLVIEKYRSGAAPRGGLQVGPAHGQLGWQATVADSDYLANNGAALVKAIEADPVTKQRLYDAREPFKGGEMSSKEIIEKAIKDLQAYLKITPSTCLENWTFLCPSSVALPDSSVSMTCLRFSRLDRLRAERKRRVRLDRLRTTTPDPEAGMALGQVWSSGAVSLKCGRFSGSVRVR
ncbi:hypothetical protein FB451DRAFT_1371289 [Mycena latifolia]|nr:hypothetical protein FB451DRAFT_1371289 [Mycena latifolia]